MTAGIVVDNYKVDRFKAQLTKGGFPKFTVVPFTKDTSTIKVEYEQEDLARLSKLVKTMELSAKHSN